MSQAPALMHHSIRAQQSALDALIRACGTRSHKQFGYATESVFELHLDQLRAAAKTLAFVEKNEAAIRAAVTPARAE